MDRESDGRWPHGTKEEGSGRDGDGDGVGMFHARSTSRQGRLSHSNSHQAARRGRLGESYNFYIDNQAKAGYSCPIYGHSRLVWRRE